MVFTAFLEFYSQRQKGNHFYVKQTSNVSTQGILYFRAWISRAIIRADTDINFPSRFAQLFFCRMIADALSIVS